MQTVYEAPGILLSSLIPEHGLVVSRWKELSRHQHFRPCIERHMKLVERGEARLIVIDVSAASGVPSQEDQDWFAETVFPFYGAHRLAALVNVRARSALTNLGARRWRVNAAGCGVETFEVPSVEAALDLLRERHGVTVSEADLAAPGW
jgi:hypothetical protein